MLVSFAPPPRIAGVAPSTHDLHPQFVSAMPATGADAVRIQGEKEARSLLSRRTSVHIILKRLAQRMY